MAMTRADATTHDNHFMQDLARYRRSHSEELEAAGDDSEEMEEADDPRSMPVATDDVVAAWTMLGDHILAERRKMLASIDERDRRATYHGCGRREVEVESTTARKKARRSSRLAEQASSSRGKGSRARGEASTAKVGDPLVVHKINERQVRPFNDVMTKCISGDQGRTKGWPLLLQVWHAPHV
jgi:hypothetical protein